MAQHHPVTVDPKELQRAQTFWDNFTQLLKYTSLAVAITLLLLALAFTG